MMQGDKLRRADLITSVLLMGFSVWMLFQTLQMPMRDTFGGVQNVWYVSPGLFPLFISISLFALGTVLLVHSIRTGGLASLIQTIEARVPADRSGLIRLLAIVVALVGYVYLNIPRVDFFLSTSLFLFYFLAAFHFDDEQILKRMLLVYSIGNLLLLGVFITGLSGLLNSAFLFSTDVIALAFLVGLIVYVRRLSARLGHERKQFRLVLLVTFLTPLVLVPVFRYFLRVPLPREGGIVEIMNLIYYSLR